MTTNSNELESLILQALQGDQPALTQLFTLHRDRLTRMIDLRIDRRVQARVATSDVLQEAYVDLAQQLGNYSKDPKLPFFLWLRRITWQRLAKIHRSHIDQAKRSVLQEVPMSTAAPPSANSGVLARQLVGGTTSPSGLAIRRESWETLKGVIDTMSPGDREIIALRHFEQLSNQETSIVLDISAKAASVRHTRAILRLQEAIEQIPGMLD